MTKSYDLMKIHFVSAVMNLRVLLPEGYIDRIIYLRVLGSSEGIKTSRCPLVTEPRQLKNVSSNDRVSPNARTSICRGVLGHGILKTKKQRLFSATTIYPSGHVSIFGGGRKQVEGCVSRAFMGVWQMCVN
jgi:hypothetical protein